jgi:hypothetical protein
MRGVKCDRRVREVGLLVHKIWGLEVELSLERSSSFLLTGFFQRFILLSVRQLPDYLINAIQRKRNLEAAQSKATLPIWIGAG